MGGSHSCQWMLKVELKPVYLMPLSHRWNHNVIFGLEWSCSKCRAKKDIKNRGRTSKGNKTEQVMADQGFLPSIQLGHSAKYQESIVWGNLSFGEKNAGYTCKNSQSSLPRVKELPDIMFPINNVFPLCWNTFLHVGRFWRRAGMGLFEVSWSYKSLVSDSQNAIPLTPLWNSCWLRRYKTYKGNSLELWELNTIIGIFQNICGKTGSKIICWGAKNF